MPEVHIVVEATRCTLETSGPLHVDGVEAVHQDVCDVRVSEQGLEGPESHDLVQYLVHQPVTFGSIQGEGTRLDGLGETAFQL